MRPSVLLDDGDDDQVAPPIFKVPLRTIFYFLILKPSVLKLKRISFGKCERRIYVYLEVCLIFFSSNPNLRAAIEEKTDGLVSIWKTGGRPFFLQNIQDYEGGPISLPVFALKEQ